MDNSLPAFHKLFFQISNSRHFDAAMATRTPMQPQDTSTSSPATTPPLRPRLVTGLTNTEGGDRGADGELMPEHRLDHDRVLDYLEQKFQTMDSMYERGEMNAFGKRVPSRLYEKDSVAPGGAHTD